MTPQRLVNRRADPNRHRPISCNFCKSRKLRCSRESPCSNCASRGIPCQLPLPQTRASASQVASEDKTEKAQAEIFERLRRLEELVTRQAQGSTPPRSSDSASQGSTSTKVQPSLTSSSSRLDFDPARIPLDIQDLAADAARVEQECRTPSLLISLRGVPPPRNGFHVSDNCQNLSLADRLMFKIGSLEEIQRSPAHIQVPEGGPNYSPSVVRCIWLPLQEEVMILVRKYVVDFGYMHNVNHLPTLETAILDLYEEAPLKVAVQLGRTALLLSVIATVTSQWTRRDAAEKKLFASPAAALQQTVFWMKATLDVVDYSRRTSALALEHVQALVITMFVLCNLEGFSVQFGTILSTAILAARDLGLHLIDHKGEDHPPRADSLSFLEAEAGRRVWWHLTSTDWFLSQGGGHLGKTYLINPAHVATNKPLDLHDNEFGENGPTAPVPASGSPPRTYRMLRIRLAELCREATDRLPIQATPTASERFDAMMEFDSALHTFLHELPPAFKLKCGSMRDASGPSRPSGGNQEVVLQRYVININVCTAICRIHFPYLTRASVDPAFAYSRDACVQAARHIIWAEMELEMEQIPFCETRLGFFGLLYFAFMASIVLLLDMRLSAAAAAKSGEPSTHCVPATSRETYEACRLLERSSHFSPTARKAYQLFMQLRSDQDLTPPSWAGDSVNANTPEVPQSDVNGSVAYRQQQEQLQPAHMGPHPSDMVDMYVQDNVLNGDYILPQSQIQDASSAVVDGIWQHFENGVGLDDIDWKSLLSGIEPSLMGPV